MAVLSVEGSQKHWAFQPLTKPTSQSLDRIVRLEIKAAGVKPTPPADKYTLIRRAYFDLIGLPPSPNQIRAFIADKSTNAFEKVVDELLNSRHYGERWGRHWLDVARYGDSNGGDENHAFPHAWRYRNWVINAFNRDLPYDEFLRDQLAGDLVQPMDEERLPATGFLAIGTKILAEQDPVKKRADIVDEQLDTIGRVFLGLSIGCARCHDHKFDPIPTRDYYAMAGIFHSTTIGDRELTGDKFTAQGKLLKDKLAEITASIADLNRTFTRQHALEWEAEAIDRGNVIVLTNGYGKGIGIIGDRGKGEHWAEYDVKITHPGTHILELRYAAKDARPGQIKIDGKPLSENAISETTGEWGPSNQRWHIEGKADLSLGQHVLRIESKPLMSHIDKVRLSAVDPTNAVLKSVEELHALKADRIKTKAALRNAKPMTMAVRDGQVKNSPINRLGNPHDHGEKVPRGFLTGVGSAVGNAPEKNSGRLELADWITSPDHPLTARVIVNRVWHWHFGRGLVGSPDNFGTTGQRPRNLSLLDHLARRLIADKWSLKKLHRYIMLSKTYRMGTVSNPGAINGFPLRRLEAEAFRDALLQASGTLNHEVPPHSSLKIISQNPTHVTLARNRRAYEEYPYRSVYLPIVRSHVYDLFTLLDFPNATTPVGKRANTTVPTQALMMMNSPFLIKQAAAVAESVRKTKNPLDELYLRLFARPATQEERSESIEFIKNATKRKDERHAWTLLCQTLLASNESLYLR
tara:strand:- start:2305 stop:4551 length:2247 start_codon:yes stop_codon:yes gene_type:complete